MFVNRKSKMIYVTDIESSEAQVIDLVAEAWSPSCPRFSPDGTALVYTTTKRYKFGGFFEHLKDFPTSTKFVKHI